MISPLESVRYKHCSECNKHLKLRCFSKNRVTKDGLQNVCKSCKAVYGAKWYWKRRESDPDYHLSMNRRNVLNRKLKRYGLNQDQYIALAEQGCAICGGPPNGRGRYAFDHNHTSGAFRGLLCSRCNVGLGHFNQDTLWRALVYVKRYGE